MTSSTKATRDDRRATPAIDAGGQSPALKDLLAPLLADRGKTAAGQIQILGLQSIKEKLGEQWDKFLPTIQVAVENIVSTHLSSGDMSVRLSDETYLIAFAKDDRDHATQVTKGIAQQLQKMLVGASGDDAIEIRAVVGEISTSEENSAPEFEASDAMPTDAPKNNLQVKANSRKQWPWLDNAPGRKKRSSTSFTRPYGMPARKF